MVQPEYRIYEMNKRLQARTEVSRPEITAARSRLGCGTGGRVAGCGGPVRGGGEREGGEGEREREGLRSA